MSTELLKQAVDYFGNQKKAADALGITQPTLNHSIHWRCVSGGGFAYSKSNWRKI